MNIEFILPAEHEFFEAIDYLNSESEGLGYEFAAEVKSTLERIIQFPNAWHPLSERTRRCRTKRFPYSIVYQLRQDKILIIAVMHMHREPQKWKSRLGLK